MKHQINLLNQLQELVLTRDEHRQNGDGSRLEELDKVIADMATKLEVQPRAIYDRLMKKDHVVMSPMLNGSCGLCGMKLPISQVQQVRLVKTIQTCGSCGRILYNEEEDAPKNVAEKPARDAPRKTGVSRFSAAELMVVDLDAKTPESAVRALAKTMEDNRFVTNADALVGKAMEREAILSTSVGSGIAFPHVRGVEGGGLAFALGISKKGIKWDDSKEKVNFVFFTVIPVAVSAFYLRLMAGLIDAVTAPGGKENLLAAKTGAELWKVLIRATKHSVR